MSASSRRSLESRQAKFGQMLLFRAHPRRSVDHRLCSEADVRVKYIIFPRP